MIYIVKVLPPHTLLRDTHVHGSFATLEEATEFQAKHTFATGTEVWIEAQPSERADELLREWLDAFAAAVIAGDRWHVAVQTSGAIASEFDAYIEALHATRAAKDAYLSAHE